MHSTDLSEPPIQVEYAEEKVTIRKLFHFLNDLQKRRLDPLRNHKPNNNEKGIITWTDVSYVCWNLDIISRSNFNVYHRTIRALLI